MNGNAAEPLEGRTGEKLAEMLGCTYDEYLRLSQRFNILPEWPGRKSGKGDKFPKVVARINAQRISYSLAGCTVLFLGINVGRIFKFPGNPLEWKTVQGPAGTTYSAAVLPHPSGINRWWNSSQNRKSAERFMKQTMAMVAG